ncbi:MAG TPA: hypothetical protein VGD42_15060 [Lysobacter sp.]
MTTALWLAWAGYLAWLTAGALDFACHRRTDLPHTSGLGESSLHLLQLALCGSAIAIGMAFAVGRATVTALALLVAAHAVAGYLDTRQAYPRRPIRPFEQHVHSVLDMAPPIGLALLVVSAWPLDGGWSVAWRDPPLPAWAWAMVLLPAAVLCGWPALTEFRAAWRVRAQRVA